MDNVMQNETTERQAPARQKLLQRIYWMPMAVIIVGLFSFAILMGTYEINKSQRRNFALANAFMDIQINVATFHLWLEEGIFEGRTTNVERSWIALERAKYLIEAILNGGESEPGLILEPLRDPNLRPRVDDLKSLLTKLTRIGHERLQQPEGAEAGSDLDEHFDAVFNEFQDKTRSLEEITEKVQISDGIKSQRLMFYLFLVWTVVMLGTTLGLWTREAKRRTAERALQQANVQLQSQTEELKTFREHLMDLVEKRTMELITTNTHLQQEIIERKGAEESLRESENKCRILVDYLPQKIFLKDQNSVFLFCNDNFARDLNIKADEIAGKTDYDLSPREIAEKCIAEDKRIMKSGKPLDVEEKDVKDGQEAIIHKFKMPTRNETGAITGILGILWDATERFRLESIAEAVTTMNNIGSIFAGIRHEIGNPINSAKMTLSVLKKRIDTYSRETTEEYIERAMGELSRVDYLLKTLKSFNMYETPEPQKVEIKPFMDKFLSLLTDDFGKKGIAIESIFSPEAQWGYADPRALQQVLLNIMSNASDAMDGRKDPRIVIAVSKSDGHISIKVTDNGCGISEEQQKRLFMPFFTTKASGTGLGLVIAKKLVSRMNGTLEIKSRRGEGTSVEISIQEGRDGH